MRSRLRPRVFLVAALAAVAVCAQAPGPRLPPDAVSNLRAFAKLYGYLEYFHPSDEGRLVDWDRLAVLGARDAVDAGSSAQLRERLLAVFSPVAPTLAIYGDGESPPPAPAPFDGPVLAWQHRGVGLGDGGLYASVRTQRANRSPAPGAPFANVMQMLPAQGFEGQRIRMSFWARTAGDARAQGWLRVDRPEQRRGFFDSMQERPITASKWRQYTITGEVAEDAERVAFGFMVSRGERGDVDGIRLEAERGDEWRPLDVANSDFEAAALAPPWLTRAEGWEVRLEKEGAPSGDQFVAIRRNFIDVDRLFDREPAAGELVDAELGRGLRCRFPLALPATLASPAAGPSPALEALGKRLSAIDIDAFDASDLGFRAGNVIQLWNVFQHFYPYFDQVSTDWSSVLDRALARTLTDRDRTEHHRTLSWLVAQLQDGHGNVFDPAGEQGRASLPLALAWVEDQIVVAHAGEGTGVERGDIVVEIDGAQAGARLDELIALRSGSIRWTRKWALADLVRGPAGNKASLLLERIEGSSPRRVTADVSYDSQQVQIPQSAAIRELEGAVMYVDLGRAGWPEIEAKLEDLAKAPGVVFDLRGYPMGNHAILQHLSDEPIESARWNVPLQIRPDQKDPEWDTSGRWKLDPEKPRIRGPVVFLTGGGAISYAESVMAIVANYKLGEIVGEPTAGANGNVNPFGLPGDFRISWTGMRVLNHDGSQHHLLGVQPTIPAAPTIAGIRTGRDEVLERGLEAVRSGRR